MIAGGLVGRVRRIAQGFRDVVYGYEDRRDLEQDGIVGLLEAAARYRSDGGASLRTFGTVRAVGAMRDHVRCLARWARELPCGDDVARLEEPAADVLGCGDTRSPESKVRVLRFRRFLRTEWQRLPDPERQVIRMRFFDGATYRQVATRFGVSVASAVRWERQGLDLLRAAFLDGGYHL
ncbi:MAG: sigma-70 family RNA polymerase sigma factor [Deltaproteobacteria bacterium]|nr:sigma-70 family RNA polymerase sigma factor [Deltaproteobacteria bacterium]